MKDVEQALSMLGDIRAQVAAGTKFRGFAPEALALCGALAALAGLAQALWPKALAPDAVTYVAFWGIVMIASAAIAGVESYLRTRAVHREMANMMLASVARRVAPFTAAVAIVAIVICTLAPESAWLVPGLWLILTGLVAFSFTDRLPSSISLVGFWYFASGVTALVAASQGHMLSPWMMAVPQAVGHPAIAYLLYRKNRKGQAHGG